MKMVVGLGNYGKRYEKTRHNIGFITIDRLASEYNLRIDKKCNLSLIGNGVIEGEDVLFAKPQTYMNRSGIAVNSILTDNSLLPSDLIVIYDDIDLNLGTVKKKFNGGDAGHRGVRSIIESLSTRDFFRVRIGIGRPPEGIDASDYVLSKFHKDESEVIHNSIEKAFYLIKEIIKEGSKG